MRAIDTEVLIRLITRDDSAQVVAAEQFIEKGAWVSVLALTESSWVLSKLYGLGSKETANAIEMLLDHKDLALEKPKVVAEALKLFRAKPALGFADCLILHLAKSAGHLPLGTFDRSLGKIEGAQKL